MEFVAVVTETLPSFEIIREQIVSLFRIHRSQKHIQTLEKVARLKEKVAELVASRHVAFT